MSWFTGLLSGLSSAASIASPFLAYSGAESANAANQAAAREAMAFSERMYKNRYQYTMADMKKAGLNPSLVASQGVGSSPTGVTYESENSGEKAASAMSAGVSNLIAREQAKIQRATADANIRAQDSATAKNLAEAEYIKAQIGMVPSMIAKNEASARELSARVEEIGQSVKESQARTENYIKELEVKVRQLDNITSQTALNYSNVQLNETKAILNQLEYSRKELLNYLYDFGREMLSVVSGNNPTGDTGKSWLEKWYNAAKAYQKAGRVEWKAYEKLQGHNYRKQQKAKQEYKEQRRKGLENALGDQKARRYEKAGLKP